eukprot:CAMPEP_0115378344 /NCGR_PEP_ID=MMETSP0271-20121206/3965_1 /TAXON_ID=71861 /ORGANISM="Scrippsiella trochoidea, Strain CCMP3099" /LENGTH=824 /DNA_ID=CAMNT_0002801507 /DNA_START=67 /DNA_END=2539 /DNA_ORIENTATION=-
MHVIESAFRVAKRTCQRACTNTFENRVLSVRLTNGTNKTLQLRGKPLMRAGAVALSFDTLDPGEAGTIRFSSQEGSILDNAASGCHHAGAVELELGEEHLFIGATCPLGQSWKKNSRFVFELGSESHGLGNFYWRMPQEFMGMNGTLGSSKGKDFVARAFASSVNEVDMVVLEGDGGEFEDLDSLQQIQFAETCQEHRPDCVVHALFVADCAAVAAGLVEASPVDKAFVLDRLIFGFVTSGALGLAAEALRMNSELWQRKRERTLGSSAKGCLSYAEYREKLDAASEELEEHVEASTLLLRAAIFRSSSILQGVINFFKAEGCWGSVIQQAQIVTRVRPRTSSAVVQATSDDLMQEHLGGKPSGDQESDDREETSSVTEQGEKPGVFARLLACSACGSGGGGTKPRVTQPSTLADDPEILLKVLVRGCIHNSADYVLRRTALYEHAAKSLDRLPDTSQALRLCAALPVAQRRFVVGEARGLPSVCFKSYSMDMFASLDKGTMCSAGEVLQSLGYDAVECKSLSTNSKSGEFFFISDDKRFLVKTISCGESALLQKILASYQDHILRWPHSLIVRFAGLCQVDVPSAGLSQHFIVMRSVFDQRYEIHEIYDLKGSLHHRRKKEGESIGKDEDWIAANEKLQLPATCRRELCAMHELDAGLLLRFGVMDYSLLVGVHRVEAPASKPVLEEALVSGDPAVASYRKTDARSPADDMGSAGRLRLEISAAENLIAGDWIGTSDPYVEVTLGLFSRRTHTVMKDRNPRWNCTLFLPVNEAHADAEVDCSVWDWDANPALQGGDDFLGSLKVPVAQILSSPVQLRGHKLSG